MTSTTAGSWSLIKRRRWALPAKWRNPVGIVGAVIILCVVFIAIFGPLLWTIDPNNPIYDRLLGPSWAHPFGTDDLGRDTLARIIHGARVSFQVGATAVAISLSAGLVIGITSAFYRGPVDLVLMRCIDILFAFPLLILAILIAGVLGGASRTNAMIAIGIVYTPAFARVIRGAVLEVLGSSYIESARSLGSGDIRLMRRHVLPNILAPVTVLTTVYFSQAILAEATLSFLGLGTKPPEAAWGSMLFTAKSYIDADIWMAIWPGSAIMLVVLGFNFLGDGLRDILDPRIGGSIASVEAPTTAPTQDSLV